MWTPTFAADLLATLRRARGQQPFWRDRLADLDLTRPPTPETFAALPLLRKADLPALQAATPPFGGLDPHPPRRLLRLFISPGPIFDPEGHGPDWWNSAPALAAAGFQAGDIVLNTFSYHLTPAAFIFESGAHALGCAVIPAGPGNTADQLAAIAHYRPDAYVGTPDFLKILLDKAAEARIDATSIRKAMLSGAALPAPLRTELETRGIAVRQAYGTADLGIVAYEDGGPGLRVTDRAALEIVRPGTHHPVPPGDVGEVVVTRLAPEYPLFRFATGDLSCLLPGAGPPRIKGWLGRADQATKIRGMFVRPEQLAALARANPSLGRLRLVVTRHNDQDIMTLHAEHDDPTLAATLAPTLANQLADLTKLRAAVEIAPRGSLPNDGKIIADQRPTPA